MPLFRRSVCVHLTNLLKVCPSDWCCATFLILSQLDKENRQDKKRIPKEDIEQKKSFHRFLLSLRFCLKLDTYKSSTRLSAAAVSNIFLYGLKGYGDGKGEMEHSFQIRWSCAEK
jgi:hypothetical protein